MLVLSITLFLISSTALLFWGIVACAIIFGFLSRWMRVSTKHNKKLHDEEIAVAVENAVDKTLKDIESKIKSLPLVDISKMDFDQVRVIKKQAEDIQKSLLLLTDPKHCTMLKRQTEQHHQLGLDLGKVFDTIYYREQQFRGAPSFINRGKELGSDSMPSPIPLPTSS